MVAEFDLQGHVTQALALLEATPGDGTWEQGVDALAVERATLQRVVADLDGRTARRYLTAYVIAATVREKVPRTSVCPASAGT